MPSPLDRRLSAAFDAVTGPGGMIQVGETTRDGRTMPIIANAPGNLRDYFAYFCHVHADKTFIVEGDQRLSFAETFGHATALARALVGVHGVRPGDRVGIAMRNTPAWIISFMAAIMAGGVATLLNGWWQAGELADGVGDTGTRLVLADPQRAERLATMDHGATVLTIDIARPVADALAPVVAGTPDDVSLPPVDGDTLATILFTSGSTGRSKGAFSTHRQVVQGTFNYVAQTLMIVHILTEDGLMKDIQPATLISTPLFHVTAMVPVFLQSFALGRKLVLMPKWDAREAMRLIAAEQCNYFVGVPLMSYEMLVHPDRPQFDLSSCTSFAAGGAPRPPEHVKRLAEGMGGGKPLLGYGLTETNAVGCGNINENYIDKPLSTGPASRPLVDLAILDDDGRPVAQGQTGEVCIRSVANFTGYWNNPDATREAFTDDGYFRTGDLGYLDEDGYLFIVDRKKDIIIRGGENISCIEVEAALYEHPAVAEAAVFGLPDDRLGEVPGAVVHLDPRQPAVGADDLAAFLEPRLAAFKRPQRLWLSPDPLPRGGTEKIEKKVIRQHYAALVRQVHPADGAVSTLNAGSE